MFKNIFLIWMIFSSFLLAKGSLAGTEIINQASLTYTLDNRVFFATSNKLIDIVDQKIDMQMSCQESAVVVVGVSEEKRALFFKLSNIGNGKDTYSLTTLDSSASNFFVNNAEIYLDNGDGLFSVVDDTPVHDVNLSADSNVSLFFVADIPDDADKLSFNGISVHSTVQGNLLYGESKKVGDYYVVATAQTDAMSALCTYEVSHLALELEKTATLSSAAVFSGSTIHYRIAVKAVGTGEISNVLITDNIPQGTEYIEESLALDGISAGDFNGTMVSVNLGTVIQLNERDETTHYVSFDVRVQ